MEKSLLTSTLRTARWIFFAVFFQASVFSFWGAKYFITSSLPTSAPTTVYVVFSLMAIVSFIYGFRFFQNYVKIKKTQLLKHSDKKQKETLLLVYAIHILLLEFVDIIGIMLAIFTQTPWLIFPFYFLFAVGMAFSLPRESFFIDFFKTESVS